MKLRLAVMIVGLGLAGCSAEANPPMGEGEGDAAADAGARLNAMVPTMEHDEPVLGLYAPRPRARRMPGDDAPAEPEKTPAQLAAEVMAYDGSDFVFDGSMEGGVEEGLPAFQAFADALREAGADVRTHPLAVKTQPIAPDPAAAAEGIAKQLDTGASVIMFVGVESAEEARQGIQAMRYASNGGTRPDRVGTAPAYWGVSEAEYREKADLWPLDPDGELVNWTIVESKEGLEHVREIAAVDGIGVLWPGAGTLRGVFSSQGPNGERVVDTEAWEAAIQQVLAACKEFDVPCGYPAGPDDIQMRMDQGFSVFVMGWGDAGFRTIEIARGATDG